MLFREVRQYDAGFLFEMLKERKLEVNISHHFMPTWKEHCEFIQSQPYQKWYIVENHGIPVGNCYLTYDLEIGVFVLKKYSKQGIASKMIDYIMTNSPGYNYLANINPKNESSIKLFEKMGFKHIQNTYQFNS